MLMPKFSLRQALIVLGVFAVLLTFLGAAWRGNVFAIGISSGLLFSIIPILTMVLIYWIAFGIARFFNRSNLILIAFLFQVLYAPNPTAAFQQIRDTGQAPVGLIPPGAKGHDIEIESVGDISNGLGYATIWVTIKKIPAVPRTEDETFTVSLGPQYGNETTNVVRSATIPAGKTSAKVEIFYPLSNRSYVELSVFRGSNRDLRNRIFTNFYISNVAADNFLSSIFIDSKARQTAPLKYGSWRGNIVSHPSSGVSSDPTQSSDWPFPAALISPNGMIAGVNAAAAIAVAPNQLQNFPRPATVNPQLLSPNWIGITSIDVVFIRQEELYRLKKERPELCLMLERWTSVGGTLVVFELKVGPNGVSSSSEWKNANEILPTLLGDAKIEEIGKLNTAWLEPSIKLKSLNSIDSDETRQYWNNNPVYTDSAEEVAIKEMAPEERWIVRQQEPRGSLDVETETRFLVTPYAKGRIIAVQSDFRKWQNNDWLTLRNAIHATRGSIGKTFSSAYGNSSRILAIPGIGEPPLQVFQVLVGLFVLLAGPGVYWTLKSTEKLQLFFFVVPILSLLTSLMLFGYIVVADGFDSYGRVQSVTWVDHQTRASATSANATYYHNRRPKAYDHTYNQVPLNLDYTFYQAEQSMGVLGGQIAPRTQHRFENVTSQTMEGYIKLVAADEPDSKPMIQNQMGAKVRWVAFRTKSGWIVGENIENEQTIKALEVKSQDMPGSLANLSFIIGQLSPDQRLITASDRYSYYYGYDAGDQKQDLIERLRLADLKSLEEKVDERGYLAIMERLPQVEKQLQKVIFKNQLHVVVGRW